MHHDDDDVPRLSYSLQVATKAAYRALNSRPGSYHPPGTETGKPWRGRDTGHPDGEHEMGLGVVHRLRVLF